MVSRESKWVTTFRRGSRGRLCSTRLPHPGNHRFRCNHFMVLQYTLIPITAFILHSFSWILHCGFGFGFLCWKSFLCFWWFFARLVFAWHSCNSVVFGLLVSLCYSELENLSRIDDIFVTLRVPIMLSARCALFRSLVNIPIQFLRVESFRFVTVRSKLEESQI